MRSFQHIIPSLRLFSGADSLGQLGRELDRLRCRRAVIICGNTISRDGSPLHLVRTALGDCYAGVFPGVRAHSPIPAVEATAQELRRLEADAVIAVGGGSAIVTARAASILLAENSDPRSLCTTRDERGGLHSPRLPAPKLPQFVVPTSPTTATVKAGSAIFDPVAGERLALFDPKTRAQAVFINPDLIASASRALMASAALDTLSLAIEGLLSHSGDPLADAQLMHAVRLLAERLPKIASSDDLAARAGLMHAAVLCGLGSDHTGAGMATVLGHAIGARHEADNGVVKAIVLPHVLRFNAEAAEAGLHKVAVSLELPRSGGAPPLGAVIQALADLMQAVGTPVRLRALGVAREGLPAIAEHGTGDWFLRGNPRPVRDAGDLLNVLEQAW
jgi:alcohol dehydrogenase class IV